MIATDLDGTLLRSDGTLSDRVRASVVAATKAGIAVVPATGRPRIVAEEVIAQLRFLPHWIFANGSVTWHLDRSELVRGFWLTPDLARSLIVALRQAMPSAGFAVEFEDTVAFEAGFEDVVPVRPSIDPTADLLSLIDRRIQKLLVFDHSKTVEELFGVVSATVGDQAFPCYSGLSFIELAASMVTKATAIEHLARDLGVPRSAVAAFGDNHNDIAMLEWAGRSYAMANATDDARDAADEVIGLNDDDAIADKIDELVMEAGSA